MERSAFEAKATEQLDAVYRMAYHLTRNAEQAEDLVQEVYVRALKPSAVDRFEDRSTDGEGGAVRAYLFAITHNVFYSKIKRDARGPMAVGEFFAEASSELAPDEAAPAWDLASLDWEQVDGALKNAIEDLKPEYRQVLLLWGVEGLKYREIASIIEAPIGTVMSRLHRARKLLAEALEADEGWRDQFGVGLAGGEGV
ncbi:MAG: sigma-70 family RNA polymerase sigma factor [Planctomycetota bacterium]